MLSWLAASAARASPSLALVDASPGPPRAGGCATYGALLRRSLRLGAALSRLLPCPPSASSTPPRRVAVVLPNCPEVVALHFGALCCASRERELRFSRSLLFILADTHISAACSAARAAVVNLPPSAPAPELARLLAASCPGVLVAHASAADLVAAAAASASADSPRDAFPLLAVLWVGGGTDVAPAVSPAAASSLHALGFASFPLASLMAFDPRAPDDAPDDAPVTEAAAAALLASCCVPGRAPSDIFQVIKQQAIVLYSPRHAQVYFTSGTTGEPKEVALPAGLVARHAALAGRAMALHPGDVWLSAAPLFHLVTAFAIYACPLVGCRHVVLLPPFSAAGLVEAIARERVSVANLASTMVQLLVTAAAAPGGGTGGDQAPLLATADVSSLRVLSCGGSPLPDAAVKAAVARLGCPFFVSYGSALASSNTQHMLTPFSSFPF